MNEYKKYGRAAAKSGAAAKLDLRTLTEIENAASQYGMSKYGSGRGWGWTVTAYPDNTFDVLGVHTEEGVFKSVKSNKPKKPRAKTRAQMNPEEVERSLRRTKKSVRELAMMLQPNKMLTLTTRKAIVEADVFKRIASRFFALCRKNDLKFQYVAVFERHMSAKTSAAKFGSLHLHVATRGYLNYNKLRHLWRKSVQAELKDGDYEGANINASESNSKGRHYSPRSIAFYLAKYLSKDMDDEYFEPNKRRYWSSKGIEKPQKLRIFSAPATYTETFREMFSDILGVDIKKMFIPESIKGQPPIIWLSTG